jgi:predicted ArsR family transcriptional regulator
MNGRGVSVRSCGDLNRAAVAALSRRGQGTASQVAKDAGLTEGGALVLLRALVSDGLATASPTAMGPGPYGAVFAWVGAS